MNTGEARALFIQYVSAVAYVAVERPDGSQRIGTATHVGDGVYVTARHVIEGNRIIEIVSTERTFVRLPEGADTQEFINDGTRQWPAHSVYNDHMTVARGPYFHPSEKVDLAAFVVDGADPLTPWVPLGSHLDDWIGGTDLVLTEVVVMGYPPIPMTRRPYLVATRAEINAQVDYYDTPHVHWIVSTPARGGFSGSMVIDERGIGLGVVNRSVVADGGPEELGFMSATSVEPVFVLLAEAKILPPCQSDGWEDFWNADGTSLSRPSTDGWGRQAVAQVEVFDDGQAMRLTIRVHNDADLLARAADVGSTCLRAHAIEREVNERAAIIRFTDYDPSALAALQRAAETVLAFLGGALPGVSRDR